MKKPTLQISIEGGRAEENSVSFRDLALTLNGIQEAIISVARSMTGRQISRKGLETVCALEAVAGLRTGSFAVAARLANYSETPGGTIGLDAARELILGVRSLAKREPQIPVDFDYEVFQNLQAIISLLEKGYRTVELTLNGTAKPVKAKINSAVKSAISGLQMPIVRVHETEVVGTLSALEDRPSSDFFVGEIVDISKKIWKVRFDASTADLAASLWRKKVRARGVASFYEIRSPMLKVLDIQRVEEDDFLKALDEMTGAGRDLYSGLDLQAYIRELRER